MAFLAPDVRTQVVAGAVVQTGAPAGLPILMVGTAPMGPTSPTLISNHDDGVTQFGSSAVYSDLQGWSIPAALDLVFANQDPNGLSPQVLVVRVNTTPASVLLSNGASSTGAWTATAQSSLGGTSGNGTTLQYAVTGVVTITPPLATGLSPETYTGLGATATWAQVAAAVNPVSKILTLTLSGADGPAAAATTVQTLATGADGPVATLASINAGLDSAVNIQYGDQPINIILPLYADTLLTAGTTVVGHALANAITMLTSGNQRAQVIGSVGAGIVGVNTAATATSIASLATSLNLALDNAGDSGRCTIWANYLPYRFDPLTNLERQYPGWAVAAAYAGMISSLLPSTPRGRRVLRGFSRFGEGYTPADIALLIDAGVQVARKSGKLVDQVTTANRNSYKRGNSIQTQEDVILSTLAGDVDSQLIEIATSPGAAQYIDNFVTRRLVQYALNQWMYSATASTKLTSQDQRQAQIDLAWSPDFDLRHVTIIGQLVIPVPSSSTTSLTV